MSNETNDWIACDNNFPVEQVCCLAWLSVQLNRKSGVRIATFVNILEKIN